MRMTSPAWERFAIWAALVGLLVAFGLALTSARVKSATFDEDAYVGKGSAIWMAGNYWLRTAHPPLAPMLGTLPLLTEPGLAPPTDHGCWPDGSARSCGRLMLFYKADTQRVLLLARLPVVFLTCILAALVFHWARELYGVPGGLLALALCVLDPNILAHGRLLTLDLATAFFVFLSWFALYRFWRRPGWARLVLLGLALGAAGATRFTSGYLVPLFALVSLARVWHPVHVGSIGALGAASRWRRMVVTLLLLLAVGVVAGVTVWIVNGADFGPVPRWSDVRLPAPAYFNELAALWEYRDKPQDAFLLGRHYLGGWWLYFPVALLVKTPLATLFLFAAAVVLLAIRRDGGLGEAVLLVAAGGHLALSLLSPFNIGYRHLLPTLPFVFVFAGRAVRIGGRAARRWFRYVPPALAGWLAVANVVIYPHYLAYFNELVGPRNGYRVLVDSNLDWGQDLPALERYVEDHDVESLYLSWFGESRPGQYGIPYRSIPSKPDELSDIYTRVYHPDYPPPGTYAISATNLQALLFDDKALFAYFLQRDPVAQPGYSVMVYDVPRLLDSDVVPAAVALGSSQIDQVPVTVFETYWHTSDLRLRWFDAATSCVLPVEGESWTVLPAGSRTNPPPCPFWEEMEAVGRVSERAGEGLLDLYRLSASPARREQWMADLTAGSPLLISDEAAFAPGDAPDVRRAVSPPLRFGDRLDLVGYRALSDGLDPGEEWQMVSTWRVASEGGVPLKLFVQLLDDAGSARAKYDGLDAPVTGWREGDLLAQRHTLVLPDDLSPGRYWVQIGAYEAKTGRRLPVLVDGEAVGTRVLLPLLEVE